MRWVLVFKAAGPGQVKAKARIVILGFSDPDDVGVLNTKSPTMSRRSRQLLLQLSTHRSWQLLKADAKAAFLQGTSSQQERGIFGIPVEDL